MNINIVKLLPIFFALTVTSCTDGEDDAVYEADPQISVPENLRSDELAVSLFREVVQEYAGNVVISPKGAEAVLRMLKQGARGEVAAELASLSMGEPDVPTAMQPTEANALFVDESLRLNPDMNQDAIPAPLTNAPIEAVQQMNAWVGEQTHGRVSELLSTDALKHEEPVRMVLANAMVLQEKWLRPFSTEKTRRAPFYCADDSSVMVEMMQRESCFRYAVGDDWQAMALFYRTDGRQGNPGCFIGILPEGNARDFAATLTVEKYTAIRRALAESSPRKMVVELPAFTMNAPAISLVKPLQDCGLKRVFSYTRDWGGFTDEELRVQELLQCCYVQVDEQGTRAAASTAAIVGQRCVPETLTFERPFIWMITDLSTPAAPYFMGILERP